MKLESKIAKEAQGKSLLSLSDALFKSILIAILIGPLTTIFSSVYSPNGIPIDIWNSLSNISSNTRAIIATLLVVASFFAIYLRFKSISILNEIEE
jgi:hypothetical protein